MHNNLCLGIELFVDFMRELIVSTVFGVLYQQINNCNNTNFLDFNLNLYSGVAPLSIFTRSSHCPLLFRRSFGKFIQIV